MSIFDSSITEILKKGGVGVIPTDTLYGVVGRADMQETVERIYAVRERNPSKPCIILISSYDDLKKFNVDVSPEALEFLQTKKLWPGKVSVIFPCHDAAFDYLTRGTESLSFRLPDFPELQEFIKEVGPIIAPSANPEGKEPATTIQEAKAYFGDKVDFYVDGGVLKGLPSTLIRFDNGQPTVLRQGAVSI